jgi:DNA-binding response OmpR family regulator
VAKILVIENSDDVREMITVVLKSYGHDVVSSSETININSIISHANPQLILLDIWLGHQSGKEICEQIKRANKNLSVILMSADAKLLADYESCKADDILEKPFDILDLKDKIDRLLIL